jgi:hypothetical protein
MVRPSPPFSVKAVVFGWTARDSELVASPEAIDHCLEVSVRGISVLKIVASNLSAP